MNQEKIDQIVELFLSSDNISDPMTAREPIYEAQELWKSLSPEDAKQAIKLSVIALIKKGSVGFAMQIFTGYKLFPELVSDPEVKAAAQAAYENAKQNQYEDAEEIKEFFQLN